MLISSAFLTPGLSTFSQGLLAVPRDRHLGGLPWPHRKFSAPASSLEGGWDQENSFSEEAWGPQRAEARLGYSQGAGKQPRCGWRAHITGRELENDLGVAGGHTSQAGVFPALRFPWSKFTSLTLADEGMVVPGQLFTPLEKSPISTPIHSILPPLALTFHHPYGLYLPNSAGKFPKVKGFGSSFSSIIKPCSYQLHWI